MLNRKSLLLIALPVLLASCDSAARETSTAAKVEPHSGISLDALLGAQSMRDGDTALFMYVYSKDRIDPEQLKAAPANTCASNNLKLVSVKDTAPEHSGSFPAGSRKLVVRCK